MSARIEAGMPIPEVGVREQPADIGRGGRVADEGPGADGGEVVSDHIGDHVAADPSRRESLGEASAAPPGEALPDPVHRGDVEAGAEKQGVERGEVGR